MDLDLSKFPEPPATYAAAIEKIQSLITEGETYQRRLAELNNEISYYQGIAKTLEPKRKVSDAARING